MRPWLLAARPRTLPASIAPVLVGTALAVRVGHFQWPVFLATLLAAVLLQVGANYANDVFDFLKGADAQRQGPLRVTQSGLLSPRQMLAGTALVFVLAALVGLYLVEVGGVPILMVGALSILSAVAYTAEPFALAYRGLGDVFAFVFFGLVAVGGTYYLQTLHLDVLALVVAIPPACLVTNILVVNNLRDLDTDRAVGKRTLATRIGDRASRLQYTALFMVAMGTPAVVWASGALGPGVMVSWLSLPVGVRLLRDFWAAPRSAALNPILARTAQFQLLFCALFALGIGLAR